MATDQKEVVIDLAIIEMLFELMKKEEILELSKTLKINVPGFSQRRLNIVPGEMLKNYTFQRVKQKGNFDKFIDLFIKPIESDFEGLSPEEMNIRLQLHESITLAQSYAIVIRHPQLNKHKNSIEDNIRDKRPILHGIVNEEVDFKDKLNVVHQSRADSFKEELQHYVLINEKNAQFEKNEFTSFEQFVNSSDQLVHQEGIFIYIFSKYFYDWIDELSEDEKNVLIKLSLHDLLIENRKLYERINELQNINNRLSNDLEKMSKIQDEFNNLKKQFVISKEEKISLNAEIQSLQQQITQLTNEKDSFHDEKKLLKKEIIKLQDQLDELKHTSLFDQFNFILINKSRNSHFRNYLNEEQYVQCRSIKEITQFINENDLDDKVIFINGENISSKNQFVIESALKKRKLTFKWLSGDTKYIIRKIAYYMEGN